MARAFEKLSDLKVRKVKTAGYLGDGGGLYLQVSPSLSKSWVFRYQVNGRTREMGLGSFNTFGLRDARDRATGCRKLLADGIDPIEQRNAAHQRKQLSDARVMTFGQCCEKYIEAHRSGWKNVKHASQWDATLRTYCTLLWPLDVAAIDTVLVMKSLEPIWKVKTETASRVRGRIESVLAWATVRKFRTGDNPAAWRNHLDQLLPKRSKVQKVEHRAALPYSDIPQFMTKLRLRQGLSARALELQILTATRPGEAAGAQWEEFNVPAATWIIPAERMKAGKEHRVPLSQTAVGLLRSLIPSAPTGKLLHVVGHVFPGVKDRPLTTAAAMNLLKDLHPDITAHGFRSTFRDWAAETTKHPREVIEAAMAHRLKDKSEAAYQRGDLLIRRARLMNDWDRHCRSAG
ncbi:site-specific integrase [Rhodanobacter sp. C01]|uniref:tyrosine-type recombinase/integrase n=1 Tax=Rhodanobacter sp. C01 TaxID=1945856 RepID=UPI0009860DE5|nr:site-specific integrase [Rhodanobacter sp. C01]OOG47668.1 integrase [Rhodanobacter sp. C01]